MSILGTSRTLIRDMALRRAANRLGVDVDDLPDEVVMTKVAPGFDATRWGLPPDAEITAARLVDPVIAAVVRAADAGNWLPAAELLVTAHGDRRTHAVGELARLAADDDGWLTAWREARPGDGDAAVVHAESLVRLAWQIRGSARADATTREQFDGFHRVIASAETAARSAALLLPADPTPWVTRITAARALGYDRGRFRDVWDELVARDPHHLAGHEQALQYWCAKWQGSDALVLLFASAAAASAPSLAHLPLLAAAECEDPAVWRSDVVRGAVDRLVGGPPGQGEAHGLAAFALAADGRYDEAVEQLRLLGPNVRCRPWAGAPSPRLAHLRFRAEVCLKARAAGVR